MKSKLLSLEFKAPCSIISFPTNLFNIPYAVRKKNVFPTHVLRTASRPWLRFYPPSTVLFSTIWSPTSLSVSLHKATSSPMRHSSLNRKPLLPPINHKMVSVSLPQHIWFSNLLLILRPGHRPAPFPVKHVHIYIWYISGFFIET